MKKLTVILLGLGLVLTACQQKELVNVAGNGNGSVTITLNASDAISVRASSYTNSAKGGFTNVTNYSLRFVLAVYDSDNTLVGSIQKSAGSSSSATFTYNDLDEDETYTAVAWADFVSDVDTDNHYDTSDFPEISYNDSEISLNDESYDAYFANQSFSTSDGTVSLTLKRPFAKLRLVATNETTDNTPDAISITYHNLSRYTSFDASTGAVSGDASTTLTYSASDFPTYSADEDGVTILVDYILVGTSSQTDYISYDATKSNESVGARTVNNVPLQRNYLTTVSGTLLNGSSSEGGEDEGVTVSITPVVDDSFTDDETNYVTVSGDGHYYETFESDTGLWALNTSHATSGATMEYKTDNDTGEGYYLVTPYVNDSGSARADIGHLTTSSSGTYGKNGDVDIVLDPTAYPIICFRFDDVNDNGYSRNISIDTSGHDASGTAFSGNLASNSNAWGTKYYCSDGSAIVVYDLSSKSFATGGLLGSIGTFSTWAIKYADIKTVSDASDATYRFFWFKTFASEDDLAADLKSWSNSTGIKYSTDKSELDN